jgi:hypothetical protein
MLGVILKLHFLRRRTERCSFDDLVSEYPAV